MKLLKTIKFEFVPTKHRKKIRLRQASRAIIFDADGNIALLHVTKRHYHKLPGGGIEKNETKKTALKRECWEEIGCKIKIIGEVGRITEFRTKILIKQESFCYIAQVVGRKGKPHLAGYEIDEGFKVLWLPPAEAIKAMEKDRPRDYLGKFMNVRDLMFLQAAKKI